MTGRITLRPGTPADADVVGRVFLACWHVSYADLLSPAALARYDEAGARALWRRVLTGHPDGTLVADLPGDAGVRGVVRFGPDPDDPDAGHVFSLYVHPDGQGLGLGGRLLGAAVDRLRAAGHDAATLWVFAANASARAFYARHGFTPDGTTRIEPEYAEPELRLRRPL
ncbi:GNAT family N-acetyltransferase [Micromonospora zhanjiangensis]|uniref:GNAT family N-acetyltransferase n=1 Tax=Micromonospora zhanjiangensis TaxID=1522057 RepID=A0ABV8KV64_9ACTN